MTPLSAQVLFCMDCVFWCGRCVEPTLAHTKMAVNKIASSEACSKFRGRIQRSAREAYV
jgi:hypothetical protein